MVFPAPTLQRSPNNEGTFAKYFRKELESAGVIAKSETATENNEKNQVSGSINGLSVSACIVAPGAIVEGKITNAKVTAIEFNRK